MNKYIKPIIFTTIIYLCVSTCMAWPDMSQKTSLISTIHICKDYVGLTKKVVNIVDVKEVDLKEAYRLVIPQQNENIVIYFAQILQNLKSDSAIINPNEVLLGVCIEKFHQRQNFK